MKTKVNAILNLIFVVFLSFLLSCGKTPDISCSPNFIQGGFGAEVTYVANNDFIFKVCYNDDFIGSQVSFYGVESQADIATIDLNNDVRLPHVTDGLFPGQTFPVTFNNDDSWFVIFEDDNLGNYDNSTQILRGQFR